MCASSAASESIIIGLKDANPKEKCPLCCVATITQNYQNHGVLERSLKNGLTSPGEGSTNLFQILQSLEEHLEEVEELKGEAQKEGVDELDSREEY
ncbi:hypothetical protein Fmac_020814 [Flemingia macrophylla]|uniref:Uncharacterized protein n=1 Tax=Flemingia macrophylla TaxID=520843 RepID=A0ABD1LV20_9FABA